MDLGLGDQRSVMLNMVLKAFRRWAYALLLDLGKAAPGLLF